MNTGSTGECGNSGWILITFLIFTFGCAGFCILCAIIRKNIEYREKSEHDNPLHHNHNHGYESVSVDGNKLNTSGIDERCSDDSDDSDYSEMVDLNKTMMLYTQTHTDYDTGSGSKHDSNMSAMSGPLLDGVVVGNGLNNSNSSSNNSSNTNNVDNEKENNKSSQNSLNNQNNSNNSNITLKAKARLWLIQYRILLSSLFKLLIVSLLTLGFEQDWIYCPGMMEGDTDHTDHTDDYDGNIVDSCGCEMHSGAYCQTLCEEFYDEGYAELTASCACTYGKVLY